MKTCNIEKSKNYDTAKECVKQLKNNTVRYYYFACCCCLWATSCDVWFSAVLCNQIKNKTTTCTAMESRLSHFDQIYISIQTRSLTHARFVRCRVSCTARNGNVLKGEKKRMPIQESNKWFAFSATHIRIETAAFTRRQRSEKMLWSRKNSCACEKNIAKLSLSLACRSTWLQPSRFSYMVVPPHKYQ